MAVTATAKTVSTTATRLDTASESDHVAGQSLVFYNNGSVTIYMGGSGVTTAAGVPVPAGSWSPSVDVQSDEGVYGIVAAGTAEARVLEVGV